MHTLTVEHVRHRVEAERQTLSAIFSVKGRKHEVWFSSDAEQLNCSAEPFLPVALIPAMRRHWALAMEGDVSPVLLEGVGEIQRIMTGWYSKFRTVPISAPAGGSSENAGKTGEAAFFSAGVDSFYTLMQRRSSLTHLIFVHGFDLPLDWPQCRQRMAQNARDVADRLGLRLIEVETNMRAFGDPHVSWPNAYFGAGLGAVALLLSPGFRRIHVPASVSYDQLMPMGSHPQLDPHWSNGFFELMHDGAELARFDKIRAIADWPPVAGHLRVCYQELEEGLNCGCCRKCLWTMLLLEALGRLEAIGSFPGDIDVDELKRYPPVDKHQQDRFREAIRMLAERGDKPELQQALTDLLDEGARLRDQGTFQRLTNKLRRRTRKLLNRARPKP